MIIFFKRKHLINTIELLLDIYDMLVITIPRSGGTIFTYDLSRKFNLEFAGQVHSPNYVEGYYKTPSPNWKELTHETKLQPKFTPEKYYDIMIHPEKYAILYNGADNSLLLKDADYLLLRRNLYNNFASYIKYHSVIQKEFGYSSIDYNRLAWDFSLRLNCVYNICLYSLYSGKKISWYEDYYTTADHDIDETILKYFRAVHQTSICDIFVKVGGLSFEHLL